jgi:hypothetical protein
MYARKINKKAPPTFRKGRICKKYRCKQALSIYNAEIYCHVHRREFMNVLN